jgi:TolB-like protein/class 3 adenylate cyclase/Flp pilus assembly protein TadD
MWPTCGRVQQGVGLLSKDGGMAETPEQESQGARLGVARRFSFGSAVLDERSFRLFVNSKPVELERKPLEVLLHLLRHAGKLVTKDELLAAVWPGRILTETVLTKCVQKLREVLDDDDQRLIATVHGQGYRLDAEVRSVAANASLPSEAADDSLQPSRRLAAVMFTDLVGYSALAHRDEALAIELLELHRGWVREILPKYGGREIETVGDAFLIEFSGALSAVECAIAIQQRFTDYNSTAPENRHMQLRIGIHLGDVEHKNGKVMGDGVNIASRIHGKAEPGGICVSEDVHRAVRTRGFTFDSLGVPELKNIEAPLELYRLRNGSSPPGVRPRLVRLLPRRRAAALLLGAITLVGALGYAFWWMGRLAAPVGEYASVAVLPFVNNSPDKDNEYFSDGMTEEILNALAQVDGLKVPSRTSVFAYKGQQKDIRQIGRELAVQTVVEGSVRKDKGRLRITAQLINVADGYHVWSQTYERSVQDVFAVQNELAHAIVGKLRPRLFALSGQKLVHQGTANLEAYDLYLRGKHSHFRQDPAANRKSMEQLREATRLDPDFAKAHAALASAAANWLSIVVPTDGQVAKEGFAAAERALALNPDLGDAYEARGRMYWTAAGNFDAEAALGNAKRALELEPSLTDAWILVGSVLYHIGLFDFAERAVNRALELDPANLGVRIQQPIIYYYMNQFERCLDLAERIPREFSPIIWYGLTMHALLRSGRKEEAAARYQEYVRHHPDEGGLVTSVNAVLLARNGDFAAAERDISRAISGRSPFGHFHHVEYNIGAAYTLMGRHSEAMRWLEQAFDTGLSGHLASDPYFETLRGTPRFERLLERRRKRIEHFRPIAESIAW